LAVAPQHADPLDASSLEVLMQGRNRRGRAQWHDWARDLSFDGEALSKTLRESSTYFLTRSCDGPRAW